MKKIVLPFLLVFLLRLSAQPADPHGFSFGVLAGVESQALGASYIPPSSTDYPFAQIGRSVPGGSFGFFGQWHLTPVLALRPQLVLAINDNYVGLYKGTEKFGQLRYRFADVELPIHFVVTNQAGRLPMRGSFLVGARLSWNTARNQPQGISLYQERVGLDIGLGVEFSHKKWKIKPEVVYSHGINNIHNLGDTPYDWSVGRMVRDRLALRVFVWK